jgi:anti-sigma B factor antagonist
MNFRTTQKADVTVIALDGNMLGVPEGAELNGQLHKLIENGKKQVILDLSAVGFINSSGLSALIHSASTLKKSGGRMVVAGASKKVLELIKVTKLTPLIEALPDVGAALATFPK